MTAPKRRRRSRLPRFAAFAALVLVGGLYLLAAQRSETETFVDEPGMPRLEVDREAIDLGDVPVGEWATASFTITNAGDGRLRFRNAPWVKAVAGC
jgi:hypothetical protein